MSSALWPPGAATGTDLVVRVALRELLDTDGVRRVGLALSEGGGRRLRFTASDRDASRGVPWCHIDAYDDVPLTTVVRSGESVVGALDDLDPRYDDLVARYRSEGVAGLAAVPLAGHGSVPLGGVVLFYGEPQPFDDAQRLGLENRAASLSEVILGAQVVAPRRERALADLPTPAHARTADLEVDGTPPSVGLARRFLRDRLAEWGVAGEPAADASLCLSELVTNAVLHAGSPAEVRAVLVDDELTVTVRDRGTGGRRRPSSDRLESMRVHGRGLQLVAALTAAWSSELDAVGTTVWFRLTT